MQNIIFSVKKLCQFPTNIQETPLHFLNIRETLTKQRKAENHSFEDQLKKEVINK